MLSFVIPYLHFLIEAFLVLALVKIYFSKRYRIGKETLKIQLSKREEDDLIADWKPEPLVKHVVVDKYGSPPVIQSAVGVKVLVEGKEKLNFSSFNFLGFVGDSRLEERAVKSVSKYGVGSCGPRGFYGTMDVHLELEKRLTEFTSEREDEENKRQRESILYSYGFSTIASVIPAYSKRGDVIFCDKGVCFAIQKGLLASRSSIKYFEHNDMADLERLLEIQRKEDEKDPKKANFIRRFVVVEGVYINTGNIAPIPKLVELKYKYKVRLIVDESFSFAVLGPRGRGVTEHFNIPISDIDMMAASLSTGLGTVGGFSTGTAFVIDHQRLSSQGYCFSASLPPLLAEAALEGLTMIDESLASPNNNLFTKLHGNVKAFREAFGKACKGMRMGGHELAPFVHLYPVAEMPREVAYERLQRVVDQCLSRGVMLTRAKYIDEEELFPIPPSIRVSFSAAHSSHDIDQLVTVLSEEAAKVF